MTVTSVTLGVILYLFLTKPPDPGVKYDTKIVNIKTLRGIDYTKYRHELIKIDNMEYLFISGYGMSPFCINLTNERLLNQYLKKELVKTKR